MPLHCVFCPVTKGARVPRYFDHHLGSTTGCPAPDAPFILLHLQSLLLTLVSPCGECLASQVCLPVPAIVSWSCPALHQLSEASAERTVHGVLPAQACPVAAMYCQLMGLYSDWQ